MSYQPPIASLYIQKKANPSNSMDELSQKWQKMVMNLIVIAHMAEAASFFKEYKLSEKTDISPFLYSNEEFFLLICGEGTQSTTQRVAYTLGALQGQVDKIINIGIAGSLSSEIELNKVYNIRTAYADSGDKIQFKSFTTNNSKDSKVDLITSNLRVLEKNYADHLSNFAQIVDREAWAVGSVCKNFNIPWECHKYISDNAGLEEEICQRVKENSAIFSDAILEYYQTHLSNEILIQNEIEDIVLPFELYLTKTQSRQLGSLLNKLKLKNGQIESLFQDKFILDIIETKQRPKEKSKNIINYLKSLLNPVNNRINDQIEVILSPLKRNGIKYHTDPYLESSSLRISLSINSSKDLYNLQDALNQLDFNEYKKVFEGDFEV